MPNPSEIINILYDVTKSQFGSKRVKWITPHVSFSEAFGPKGSTMESQVLESIGHVSMRAGWIDLKEQAYPIQQCIKDQLMARTDDPHSLISYGIPKDETLVTINFRIPITGDSESIIQAYTMARDAFIRHIYDLPQEAARLISACQDPAKSQPSGVP
jgi:hypothetical protein